MVAISFCSIFSPSAWIFKKEGESWTGYRHGGKTQGSVTVFLTMIFLLLFSLVGVAYDCSRISASRGYVKVAGSSAFRALLGDYNQELLKEYGLFGYGGYDGRGVEDFNREFMQILEDNLQTAENNSFSSGINIYQIQNLQTEIDKIEVLTDKEIFYGQIAAFLKGRAVSDLTDAVWEKVRGTSSAEDLENKLSITEKYESGDYEELKEEDSSQIPSGKEMEQKDSAGGNPLEVFSHMVRDGVLGMVCQEKLSEKEIYPREGETEKPEEETSVQMGAADFLKTFLKNENLMGAGQQVARGKNKLMLLAYDKEVCSDYVKKEKEGLQYALEYLVAGHREEKSNLAAVVNRLLVMRTLLNFAYVVTEPVLQEKSLATATALAGFTGIPPVITGVQYTILLILAFQEGCVDVTALLKGKSVPVFKNSTNFKMKYEEICMGSRNLFQKKAEGYGKEKMGSGLQISYQEYLTVFLLLTDENTLRNRTLDIIQQNLRDKYNQSFCIDDCICKATCRISYEMDCVFKQLPFIDDALWGGFTAVQCQEVSYGYKSG